MAIPRHFFNSELGVLILLLLLLPDHSMSLGLSFIMSKMRELYFVRRP